MKFVHLSDLHIGKKVNGFSMLEDQEDVLFKKILPIIDAENPDFIIIAGDVYDKSIPSSGIFIIINLDGITQLTHAFHIVLEIGQSISLPNLNIQVTPYVTALVHDNDGNGFVTADYSQYKTQVRILVGIVQ